MYGPPGSGKTSVGALLGQKWSARVTDVDNDWLEPRWKQSVAEKLRALGDDKFLDEEDAQLVALADSLSKEVKGKTRVIALTGSNPLRQRGLEALKAAGGLLVYLDVPVETIEKRLLKMKVDRIVGMQGKTLGQVLRYRYATYESKYDLRVITVDGDSPAMIASKVMRALETKTTTFVSTRETVAAPLPTRSFASVLTQGLAPDGGLYMPDRWQSFDGGGALFERLARLSYPDLCKRVLEKFVEPHGLNEVISAAYASFDTPAVLPLTSKEGKFHTLETWHGPTASFKDLSLQLLPRLMQHFGCGVSKGLLVATSGDTGSAALDGFARASQMPVIVLYPAEGVSSVQRLQMLKPYGDHVRAIGVKSDFDWCQRLVKSLMSEQEKKEEQQVKEAARWTSANSINLGRLLPQVVFSVSAYCSLIRNKTLRAGDPFDMSIPTGNFGNIFSAILARRMGLPLRHLICASNENNVLEEFITTGVYDVRRRALKSTVSPSIDILVSSNLERWLSLLLRDPVQVSNLMKALRDTGRFVVPPYIVQEMQQVVKAGWASEAQTLSTIKDVYRQHGSLLCPHTAVAKCVGDRFTDPAIPMVVVSTASWAKFPSAIEQALYGSSSGSSERSTTTLAEQWERLGKLDAVPPALLSLLQPQQQQQSSSSPIVMDANEEALKKYIYDFAESAAQKKKKKTN